MSTAGRTPANQINVKKKKQKGKGARRRSRTATRAVSRVQRFESPGGTETEGRIRVTEVEIFESRLDFLVVINSCLFGSFTSFIQYGTGSENKPSSPKNGR
ncbi:hypothetical protein SLE2022_054110 [Rubroshorea leprosula]